MRNDFVPKIDFWDTNPNFSLLIKFVIDLDKNKIKTRLIRSINKKRYDWPVFKATRKAKRQTDPILANRHI